MAPSSSRNHQREFSLPPTVAGPADVSRLLRELEAIDNSLLQLGLRSGGGSVKMPKTSKLMDQLIQHNELNLLHKDDRQTLKQYLGAIHDKAPVIHMSFGTDPSPAFMEKLVVWLRREIHPLLLLTTGLQPTIGAGCIVRTTNKYFDLSLRQDFAGKRQLLLDKLKGLEPGQ